MVPADCDTKSRIDHSPSEPDERSVVREKGDDFHLCRSRMKRQCGIKLRGTTILTTLRYRKDDAGPKEKGYRASALSVSGFEARMNAAAHRSGEPGVPTGLRIRWRRTMRCQKGDASSTLLLVRAGPIRTRVFSTHAPMDPAMAVSCI
jgi:hypothetical protein